jgi:hypothetical protein
MHLPESQWNLRSRGGVFPFDEFGIIWLTYSSSELRKILPEHWERDEALIEGHLEIVSPSHRIRMGQFQEWKQ